MQRRPRTTTPRDAASNLLKRQDLGEVLLWLALAAAIACPGCDARTPASGPPAVAPEFPRRPVDSSAAPRRPSGVVAGPRVEAPPATERAVVPSAAAEPVYRPDDVRPRHDDARAAMLGIHRYESTRLLLYTDIDPEVARELPPVMDAAYLALVDYFGPLPPARDRSDYQMTGYIMADQERFREAGMLPQQASDLLVHGIHRGSEFWMNSQEFDYYRRHLMIHEGTHCFMSVLGGPRPPAWYMEGMAEYFGTHDRDAEGGLRFGVMPESPAQFVGFGRVEMLREEVALGRFRTVQAVLALSGNDYVASRREPYAWSWAFCKFLDAHPRYQERFRELVRHQQDPHFADRVRQALAPDAQDLDIEWELFIRNLEYGFDIPRAAIQFHRGSPLAQGDARRFDLRADAGWQASGVWVDAGATYQLSAAGEVTLALEPKPWISHPQGVSIRYSGGRPLGRVVAAILAEAPADGGEGTLWHVIDIGPHAELTPAVSGTLYFRVNDDWNSLRYNAGAYRVEIARP